MTLQQLKPVPGQGEISGQQSRLTALSGGWRWFFPTPSSGCSPARPARIAALSPAVWSQTRSLTPEAVTSSNITSDAQDLMTGLIDFRFL